MSQLLTLSLLSFKAVTTVLLVAAAGAFLIRGKFLKDEGLRVLSQCVFAIMLPCLLFSKVSERVDLSTLLRYWAVPLSALVFVSGGLLFGFAAAKALRYPPHFFKPGIAAGTFGNISFIPIPLVAAMTMVFPVFAADGNSAAQGISYISLFLMVYSPLLWSVGFRLLSAEGAASSARSVLREILNPPLIGMIAGVVVGTTPLLKDLFIGASAPLGPLFKAAEIMGAAAVPCALITLGGKLAYGPTHCSLPLRCVLGVSIVKLLALPFFALLCVCAAMKSGLMPKDALLAVVLVIEAAVPQATNLSIICAMRNPAIEKDMACVLFWNYVAATPVLAFFIVAALWTLS